MAAMPSLSRRQFAATLAAASAAPLSLSAAGEKPNILWITCEDIGPQLGCYGDKFARTPVLDALAAKGIRYEHAWSNAPVCAPARTTIISGMYPPAIGGEHMRSMVNLPSITKMYPQYLREQGYYCTNNVKTDYNLEEPGKVWDECTNKAHWKNRKPGQPFFAIFNDVSTHESQVRRPGHKLVGDPQEVRVPAYMPDTPEVRHDWTQYYDNIAAMDKNHAGKLLKELEDEGVADSTIVMFYGDHGAGLPRSKRWPYNSGLHVALIVYVPPKFQSLAPKGYAPGKALTRPVAFVDLAPTLCSIAGMKPPAQLQGRAFMGQYEAPARQYNFGFRGRMDERIDCVRSCSDGRYVYIREFMPHKIYGQHIAYMMEMKTASVWKKMYDEHKLQPPKTYFWETKPSEELYDLTTDRDEVKNLASDPAHKAQLLKMRKAVHDWQLEIKDVGLLPECDVTERSKGKTPYDLGHGADFPMARILDTAELASMREAKDTPELVKRLKDADSGVRYWAALGLQMRGAETVKANAAALRAMLKDGSFAPRLIAAEALGRFGSDEDVKAALDVALDAADGPKNGTTVVILALNVVTTMGDKAKSALDRINKLNASDPNANHRYNEYAPRLLQQLKTNLSKA